MPLVWVFVYATQGDSLPLSEVGRVLQVFSMAVIMQVGLQHWEVLLSALLVHPTAASPRGLARCWATDLNKLERCPGGLSSQRALERPWAEHWGALPLLEA